ncbi:MAG TPA: alpha/beta hydrolase [Anaerolineae bacterium]|nr:alpha/beta hydrolase [Anaerolineae bacterium]
MSFAKINGAEIYYEVAGEGFPFVMLHAGIASCKMWDPQFEHFAKSHRVIRYDLRGFGKTTAPPMEYSNRDDLLGLLDFLGVERAAIMGCSMGGNIALDFTLEHPERVATLILIAPGVSGHSISSPELQKMGDDVEAAIEAGDIDRAVELEMRMWVDGPKRTPDQVDPTIRSRVAAMDTASMRINTEGYQPQRLHPPAIERLGEVRVPTLVIIGDADQPDLIELSYRLAREIPNAQLLELHDVAHLPNLERPEEVNQAIENFPPRK